MAGVINELVDNIQLVTMFKQGAKFVARFVKSVDAHNMTHKQFGVMNQDNQYFARALGVAVACIWIIVGGEEVLNSRLSLGMFLANMNIYVKICKSWSDMYELLLSINGTFPALNNVTRLLNGADDFALNAEFVKEQEMLTRKFVSQRFTADRATQPHECQNGNAVDQLQIKIANITFHHSTPSADGKHMRTAPVIINGVVNVYQGTFTCLIGPHGQGKTTLLSIVGGSILVPSQAFGKNGICFIPSHLRSLEVLAQPLFFQGLLLDNMTFGVADGDEDPSVERVESICRLLGLKATVLQHLTVAPFCEAEYNWNYVFSSTELQLLNLARGIISNPEVLCIHRPTQILDRDLTAKIMKVLTRFVRERGIFEKMDFNIRRPRTLIITTSDEMNTESADQVFYVSNEGIDDMPVKEASRILSTTPTSSRPIS